MKITAITRFKHGQLYAILKRIGWTQVRLAQQSGMSGSKIGRIINLQERPTAEQADAIQRALGAAGEYLDVLSEWPESFVGFESGYQVEQTAEVPVERLLDCPEAFRVAAPEMSDGLLEENVLAIIGKLPWREGHVLRERFWEGRTLGQIGQDLKITRENVRQIEMKGLRRLSQPWHKKPLEAARRGVAPNEPAETTAEIEPNDVRLAALLKQLSTK